MVQSPSSPATLPLHAATSWMKQRSSMPSPLKISQQLLGSLINSSVSFGQDSNCIKSRDCQRIQLTSSTEWKMSLHCLFSNRAAMSWTSRSSNMRQRSYWLAPPLGRASSSRPFSHARARNPLFWNNSVHISSRARPRGSCSIRIKYCPLRSRPLTSSCPPSIREKKTYSTSRVGSTWKDIAHFPSIKTCRNKSTSTPSTIPP